MKKIISFVLAIVFVLCMTTAVFAENIEIKMYPKPYSADNSNNTGFAYEEYNDTIHTVTFTIPADSFRDYMNPDHHLEFHLPVPTLAATSFKVDWSLVVGDEAYSIGTNDASSYYYDENAIISYVSRVCFDTTDGDGYVDRDGYNHLLTIHSSVDYGNITSIKLIATFSGAIGNTFDSNSNYYVQACTNELAPNGFEYIVVPDTITYIEDWAYEDSTDIGFFDATYKFITGEWNTSWMDEPAYVNGVTNVIAFEHTAENEQNIINNAKNGAKLVIELDHPLAGQATYTLWAKNYGSLAGIDWQLENNCKYISSFELDGTASTLEFDIPYSALYNSENGKIVQQFVIFENITLFNATLMRNYLHFNAGWGNGAINLARYSGASLGRLLWFWDDKVNYRINSMDRWYSPVRYAAGGAADAFVSSGDAAPAKATSIKLVISDNIVEPGEEVPPHIHTLTYGSDVNVHWQFCEECEQIVSLTEHTYDNGKCTVCGAKETKFGDINGDGIVNINDAIALLKRIAGLE